MKDFVTEEEAKKKLCPYVFSNPGEDISVKCVAQNCMAWRWSHQDAGPNSPPTGFCGAFGLPKYV